MIRKNLANALTLMRIILTPVLVYFIFTRQNHPFIWTALGIMLTDSVDGTIARALHAESEFGRIMDSVADACFYPVFFFGSAVLLNLTTRTYAIMFLSLVILAAISLIIAPLIFVGRVTFIHLRTWQIATYVLLLFAIVSFFWYVSLPLLYLLIIVTTLACLETIAVCLRDKNNVNESVHSYFDRH
jgi:phosphatidylglycerophosphate synthase